MLFSFSSFSKKPNSRKCTLKCKRRIARDSWNWQNPQTSINLWVSLSSGRPSIFNNTLIACPPSDLKCKRMWNRATSILEISFVFRLQILRRKRCSFVFLRVRDFIFPDWQLPITWQNAITIIITTTTATSKSEVNEGCSGLGPTKLWTSRNVIKNEEFHSKYTKQSAV